jgi:competence protein ComEC
MKFNEFPFVRYTIFFIAGVLLYPFFKEAVSSFILPVMLLLFGVYLVMTFSYRPDKRIVFQIFLPFIAYLTLLFSGMYVASLKDVSAIPDHLVHYPVIRNYLAEVKLTDQNKPNSKANMVEVYAVETKEGWQPAHGKVQIYHRYQEALLPGTVLKISGRPQRIPGPTNPSMFDYASYRARDGVYFSHFIGKKFTVLSAGQNSSWSGTIIHWRNYLRDKIATYIEDPSAVQIASALLLGQKENLDYELREAYATAGAMHILAVSGLHVGIIYGFFFLIFRPNRLKGYKRGFYLGLIVAIIWLYAIITGLSPSVLRAATMFSFICMAQVKARNPSIFNPLALSALLLLVYDPLLIYAVGFQLSYVALAGILLFQPYIRKIWQPEKKWLRYLWDIASVSLAAQLTTFPLAVHYFHIFPTYFLFTNLLAIPAAFVIMSLGVPFLLLAAFPPLASVLGGLVNFVIRLLNQGIFGLQSLPFSKMDQLYVFLPEILLFWGTLFFIYRWMEGKKKYHLMAVLTLAFSLGAYRLYKEIYHSANDYLIIYNLNQGKVLDYMHKGHLFSLEWEVDSTEYRFNILPHRIKELGKPVNRLAFWEEDENYQIALPGRKGLLLEKQTLLPVDVKDIQLNFWKDGAWQDADTIYTGEIYSGAAIKITFNKKGSFL